MCYPDSMGVKHSIFLNNVINNTYSRLVIIPWTYIWMKALTNYKGNFFSLLNC